MSWITVLWPMLASACLTLAAIHLLVWWKNRAAWANLLFSVTAVASAVFTFSELSMMRAKTPEEFGAALRWAHVPLLVWIVSIVWFVRLYLGTGRRWLAWTVCVLRTLTVAVNFLMSPNIHYREITSLRQVSFLGESVSVAVGSPNPWMILGQVTSVLLLLFVADASITAWKKGDRRKALLVGGSIEFFLLTALSEAMLVLWAGVQAPIVFSPLYLGVVAAMGHTLSLDVIRASQLVRDLEASEAGLRESEQRMSLAVDAAEFGIWVRDLQRNDVWASDRWRELFGFTSSEPVDFDDLLLRLHPDDREALRQAHANALAVPGGGRYKIECRLQMADGATRWIASHGRIECDPSGQAVLIRGASHEITARKRAEEEARKLQHEIAHAGRVSMMGQLASALAHEINQPLGAILRNAEAAELLLDRPSPDLEEIRAILVDIRKDDQRAGSVIDRMRGLLKRQRLDTRPLDLNETVSEVVALLRTHAAARDVKLDVDLQAQLPPVQGDRIQIQQVLLNVMLNGIDALDEGLQGDRRVMVTGRLHEARAVEVAVVDSGRGLTMDVLEHAFEPFFTTKPQGMGMGLSISRMIIEAHGGSLWASNSDHGGAAFRFTLPIATAQ